MQRRNTLLRISRLLHLYLGVFTTPAILFFALTGALQTFNLHEATRGSSYQPPHWIAVAAQWHKKQSVMLPPPRRFQPPPVTPGTRAPEKPPAQAEHLPMKVFFAVVSLSLFASTATGLVLAYHHHRNTMALSVSLAAGIAVPVMLLFF